MEFAEGVVRAAWDRQRGRCAKCGRWLIWAQRGRESMTGAWQPHHKNLDDQDKRNALANCVIFCSGIADCHFKEGHGGVDWHHYAPLDDSTLLFLHAGDEEADRTPRVEMGQKRSLITAFLGISQVPAKDRQVSQKRRSKRSRGSRPGADSKERAADELSVAADP